MELSQKDIKHIADLARLGLSQAELELYGRQLSAVLEYISQLQAVDTSGIEPTAQVTGLENVWRADEIEPWPEPEAKAALGQAQEVEDDQIKVKRVL